MNNKISGFIKFFIIFTFILVLITNKIVAEIIPLKKPGLNENQRKEFQLQNVIIPKEKPANKIKTVTKEIVIENDKTEKTEIGKIRMYFRLKRTFSFKE